MTFDVIEVVYGDAEFDSSAIHGIRTTGQQLCRPELVDKAAGLATVKNHQISLMRGHRDPFHFALVDTKFDVAHPVPISLILHDDHDLGRCALSLHDVSYAPAYPGHLGAARMDEGHDIAVPALDITPQDQAGGARRFAEILAKALMRGDAVMLSRDKKREADSGNVTLSHPSSPQDTRWPTASRQGRNFIKARTR